MKIDQFKRLEELFDAALELSPDQRHAYLEKACGEDTGLLGLVERMLCRVGDDTAALRPEVEALLARHNPETETLDPPAPKPLEVVPMATLSRGDRVGHYKILEQIGEGGFAIVYAAEQTEPVRRQVALKIIKLGMDTKQVIARFEAERQALAMMDHAHVARVFDAGVTETGRPYFVMEYVAGTLITEYCDRHRLIIEQRLRLFIQVCEAVQHAHQKAIIHRDLKPSNVLVSVEEGEPLVKVIDFGVAKAISHRLTEKTIYTEQGQLIGTPEYMSPEQAEMTAQNIDTRSDIYSLGVLLYELLTGAMPFDPTTLRQATFGEIQRIIREEEPPKPSTRLSSLGDATMPCAERRRADPRSLLRELRGDLDWIVMKALEKDRSRRYETANGFALDIRRHLDHEPVLAGPPSTVYRVRKFVRRNRAAAAAGAVVAMALVVGLTLSIIGFAQANRQRAKALEARNESEAVTAFLGGMLGAASPWEEGRDVTVREMLDKAASDLGTRLRDQPLIRTRLQLTIGETYSRLGLCAEAEPQLTAALEHCRRTLGDEHVDTARAMGTLGSMYWGCGRYEEAERWLSKAVDLLTLHLGESHEATLSSMADLALTYYRFQRLDKAEALNRKVLEHRMQTLGQEDNLTLTMMNNLGLILGARGQHEEALALHEQIVETRRRILGDEHPDTVTSLGNVATELQMTGRLEEATPLFNEVLATFRRRLGNDHNYTMGAMNNLALVYLRQGRSAEAEPLYAEVVAAVRANMPPGFYGLGISLAGWAQCLIELDRLDDAEAALLEAHPILQSAMGPEHRHTLWAISLFADLYEARGRPDQAAEWREKLPTEQEAVAPDQASPADDKQDE